MGSKQLKLGVALSYVSTGLSILLSLTYTPIMLRLLGRSEYGLYTLVSSVVSYLSLFSLGFTGAYLRFYSRRNVAHDTKGVARLNGMFLTIYMIMAVAAFVCGMVLVQFPRQVFGNNLTEDELHTAQILMTILVVNIAISFPSSVLSSIVSAHEKFLFQRIVSLVGTLCNPLFTLPLLLMGYGSVAMVCVSTAITIGTMIVNLIYCKRVIHAQFAFDGFDFQVLREIAGFSFFIFINMIIDQVNWSVDKFILGWVSGTGAVAVYGVGANINTMFIGFSTAISSVFAPRVNRIAAENAPDMNMQFTKLMTRVGRIQFLVLMLIASGFVIFGKFFITDIYSSAEYADAYWVAMLLILPACVPLIQNIGIEIQRSVNKHKMRSVIYLGMAIFNVIISIPFAQKYGAIGSAIGTAISLVLANGLIMNLYYHKAMRLRMGYFWRNILSLAKGMIIPCIVGALIMRFVHFQNIGIYFLLIVAYTAVYCGSMWMIGMNEDEKQLVLKPIGKIAARLKRR